MNSIERLTSLLELPRESLETPEVMASIRTILEQDEAARDHYVHWCAFEVGLHRALGGDDVNRSAIVSQVRQQQRRSIIQFWTCSLIASFMLFLGGRFWIFQVQNSNRYEEAPRLSGLWETPGESETADGARQRFPLVRAGDRLRVPGGRFLIHFDSGAIVSSSGTVDLEIINGWELYVHHGTVCVQVPPRAHGFRVNTDSAQIVDLGTLFGVHVDREGVTDIQVMEGEIEVQAGGSTQRVSVLSGEARRIHKGESIQTDTSNTNNLFTQSLPSLLGISQISGKVQVMTPPPKSVRPLELVSDGTAFLFQERALVDIQQPLQLQASEPGTYDKANLPGQVILPVGTPVSTFLLHTQTSKNSPVDGVIRFDRPILGFAMQETILEETDREFGHPEVLYPDAQSIKNIPGGRGAIFGEGTDTITVSSDRRVIRFKLSCSSKQKAIDQIRIFLKHH